MQFCCVRTVHSASVMPCVNLFPRLHTTFYYSIVIILYLQWKVITDNGWFLPQKRQCYFMYVHIICKSILNQSLWYILTSAKQRGSLLKDCTLLHNFFCKNFKKSMEISFFFQSTGKLLSFAIIMAINLRKCQFSI